MEASDGTESTEDEGVGGLKWDHSDDTTDLADVSAPPAKVGTEAGGTFRNVRLVAVLAR